MSRVDVSHPCRGVCSGWQQGYEAGVLSERHEVIRLRKRLARCLWAMRGSVIASREEYFLAAWSRIEKALRKDRALRGAGGKYE